MYELAGKRIFVAGHRGMLGSALVRRLGSERCEVLTVARTKVDLTDQAQVNAFLKSARPDVVIIAAAKVGGILANDSYPADFLHQNLMIQTNLIGAAHEVQVEKLIFLGSSCIYPKAASQPIIETSLLTGPLEPTNEWYAVAKIAGIKLAQAFRRQHGDDFISAMPTNLYGPNDSFDLATSHVLPALVRKVVEAIAAGTAEIEIWGTGTARREFLHVDDCADACIFLLKNYSAEEHVNVGSGVDSTIAELAEMIIKLAGGKQTLRFDRTKPDGTPRKLLSSAKLASLGWKPTIGVEDGVARVIADYRQMNGL